MERDLVTNIIQIFSDKLAWKVNSFGTNDGIIAKSLDGQIKINTELGVIHMVCEIKKSVIPSSIPSIKQNIETLDFEYLNAQGAIILANYISSKAREILHQNNINYADTGGNIFLKYKTIHIYIETGQSDRSALTSETGRAFTKTGLKVLYQFFRTESKSDLNDRVYETEEVQRAHLNSSYKKIALQASVSKDTVSKVVQDLLEQGYILRKNSNEYKWKEKKIAFERWVSRINEILRPSLHQKKYRLMDDTIIPENIPLGYQIGGYYGAHRWLKLMPSQEIINAPYLIYSHKKGVHDMVQDLKIVPDPNGNVTVIEAFWKDDSDLSLSADLPLLYADLLSNSDPRMLEIAQLVYKKYMNDHI